MFPSLCSTKLVDRITRDTPSTRTPRHKGSPTFPRALELRDASFGCAAFDRHLLGWRIETASLVELLQIVPIGQRIRKGKSCQNISFHSHHCFIHFPSSFHINGQATVNGSAQKASHHQGKPFIQGGVLTKTYQNPNLKFETSKKIQHANSKPRLFGQL